MTTEISNINSVQNKGLWVGHQIWHSTTDRISKAAEKSIHFCGAVFETGKAAIQFAARPVSYVIHGIASIIGNQRNNQKCYERITRYTDITHAAWANYGAEIKELCTAVEEGNWHSNIFEQNNFPYFALGAFHQNKISEEQFCTVMLAWSAMRDGTKARRSNSSPKLVAIPLFVSGSQVNEEARDILMSTFKSTSSHQESVELKLLIDRFFQEMSKKPLSEQHFFIIDDPRTGEHTITDTLNRLGFSHFCRYECYEEDFIRRRMIPSFTMMQTYLDVKFKDRAVKIEPVIGLATKEDVNGVGNSRIMSLPFPGISLPETADNLPCPLFNDFIHHDFYHAERCSAIPTKHRHAFIKIADHLANLAEKNRTSASAPFLQTLEEAFIDMEMASYVELLSVDLRLIFWIAIETVVQRIRGLYPLQDQYAENLFAKTLAAAKWLKNYEVSLQEIKEATQIAEKMQQEAGVECNRLFLSELVLSVFH